MVPIGKVDKQNGELPHGELFAKLTLFRGYTECIAIQLSAAHHITIATVIAIGIGITTGVATGIESQLVLDVRLRSRSRLR